MRQNAFENTILLAVRNGHIKELYFALFGGTDEECEAFFMQAFVGKILAEQEVAAEAKPAPAEAKPASANKVE